MTMTIVKSCNPGLKHMEKMGNLKNRKNLEKTLTFYVCIFVKIITFTLSPPRRVQKVLKCTDPFKIPGYPALVQLTQASRSSKVQIAKETRFLGRTSRICSKMFWHIILTSESKEQTKQKHSSFFVSPNSFNQNYFFQL